jgi:hypothetical protein
VVHPGGQQSTELLRRVLRTVPAAPPADAARGCDAGTTLAGACCAHAATRPPLSAAPASLQPMVSRLRLPNIQAGTPVSWKPSVDLGQCGGTCGADVPEDLNSLTDQRLIDIDDTTSEAPGSLMLVLWRERERGARRSRRPWRPTD